MRCPQCGAESDGAFCPVCGAQIGANDASNPYSSPVNGGGYAAQRGAPVAVSDFLWFNIAATLLCCLPLGVIGIIFSCMARSAAGVGNRESAEKYALIARIIFWVALAVGIAVIAWNVYAQLQDPSSNEF